MEDRTVYIFVRSELSDGDREIQSLHAMYTMCQQFQPDFVDPRMITKEALSRKAFDRLLAKLLTSPVRFSAYSDPDHLDWGVTSVVTPPLTETESLPLANYRLRKYSAVAQDQSTSALPTQAAQEDGGSSPSSGASFNCT